MSAESQEKEARFFLQLKEALAKSNALLRSCLA
jgi:hypothetical protein